MQGCTATVVREQAAIMSYARAAYLAALMVTDRPSLARGQSAVSRGARRPTATRVKMPHFNRCESLNSANATGGAWAEKHGPRKRGMDGGDPSCMLRRQAASAPDSNA